MISGMLRQRVIKGKELKGYLVAICLYDKVYFGYSLCDNEDTVNKHNAFVIALARANKYAMKAIVYNIIPSSLINEFAMFIDRANRYFKEKVIIGDTFFGSIEDHDKINDVFDRYLESTEYLLDLANNLKEKKFEKREEEAKADTENMSNIGYWLKKATKCNSNRNFIALRNAIDATLHLNE